MAIITDSQEDGDGEVAAPSAAKAISRSDEDVFAAVLERTGGPLPFLQAAIDVARERSGLFRDPTAASKVAAMAKAARAQAVAAKEETSTGGARGGWQGPWPPQCLTTKKISSIT